MNPRVAKHYDDYRFAIDLPPRQHSAEKIMSLEEKRKSPPTSRTQFAPISPGSSKLPQNLTKSFSGRRQVSVFRLSNAN